MSDKKFDAVNRPSHYAPGKIECIDAMIEVYGVDATMDFCVCNAFKYVWRFKHKNGIEDIKKAIWYLNKYVELYNTNETSDTENVLTVEYSKYDNGIYNSTSKMYSAEDLRSCAKSIGNE